MNTAAIRAALAKRVLGVPVGILVLIGASVVLFFAIRMRSSTGDTTTDPTADATPSGDAGPTDDTQQPGFAAIPQVTSVTSDDENSTTEATTPSSPTNADWQRDAINWLIANGYTVDIATSAVTKYLNGQTLTAQEREARDKVVSHFGIPPQSIPATTTAGGKGSNAPASKQGEPPLNHTVMGTRDNTPAELARIYYGTTSSDATNKIKAANDTKTVPYATGTKVHIPENYAPKYFDATAHINTQYEIAKRNGTTAAKVEALNPHIHSWPVKAGTRVRVR